VGAKFVPEYLVGAYDGDLVIGLDTLLSTGASQPSMEQLRVLSRYQSLSDGNAVFLNNFEFVVRRGLGGLNVHFLAVWNEQVEESVRGASLFNINRLFVSYLIPSQAPATSEALISDLILRADNSYDISFKPLRDVPVPVTITAEVSVVHDPADVQNQIKTALLSRYGAGSINASRGMAKVFRYSDLYADLKQLVPALQDQLSDLNVVVGSNAATATVLPEDYRYISPQSLAVNVTVTRHSTGLWSN
jgi:hypothetical protein